MNNDIYERENLIKMIIEYGADVNESSNGKTPLYYLCNQFEESNVYINMLKLFIEKGADVNKTSEYLDHKITPLYQLVKRDSIKYCIEHGADLNIECDYYKTPFYLIFEEFPVTYDDIHYLINQGADISKLNNLFSTIFENNPTTGTDILRYLIDSNSNKTDGYKYLFKICHSKRYTYKIISLLFLVKKVDVNQIYPEIQQTALYYFCSHGDINDLKSIQLLIDKGADINKEGNKSYEISYKETPLFALFSSEKALDQIKDAAILLSNGADINKGDQSPLFYACQKNDFEQSQFLIEHGANVNKLNIIYRDCEKYEMTPLTILFDVYPINSQLVNLLIDYGADINQGSISPLWLAFIKYTKILSHEYHDNDFCEIIQYALNLGDSPNKSYNINNVEYTPLYYLCQQYIKIYSENENKEFKQKQLKIIERAIELLIKNGADVNQMCREGDSSFTLLYYICHENTFSIDLLKLFISYNADVNKESLISTTKGVLRITSLYSLCSKKQISHEAIQIILANGGDANKGDMQPLYKLCTNKPIDVKSIKLLKRYGANTTNSIKSLLKKLNDQKLNSLLLKK